MNELLGGKECRHAYSGIPYAMLRPIMPKPMAGILGPFFASWRRGS